MAAGASFIPENFDALIEKHGYKAIWKPAIVCECMEEGQPYIHCPLCHGSGYRYLAKKRIRVVSSSFTNEQALTIQGLNEPGQAYLTPERGVILGYRDKLDFYETTCKHSQALTMGRKQTSSTYRPIVQVSYVMEGEHIYEENIDFVIDEGRHRLNWIDDATKPREGEKISILYITSPEYVVTDMMHEFRSVRNNRGTTTPYAVEMPKQYLAKRLEFVYGETVNRKKEETKEELSYE